MEAPLMPDDGIKIKKISIHNYKGIDFLDLNFPEPFMQGDPDVCVLGSINGIGKTSVLECVALVILAAFGELEKKVGDSDTGFIRAGAQKTDIEGTLLVNGEEKRVRVTIHATGEISVEGRAGYDPDFSEMTMHSVSEVLGIPPEPVVAHGLFYVHSYRKIQEGPIGLGQIVGGLEGMFQRGTVRPALNRWRNAALSTFKASILKWQLSSAGLLDNLASKELADDARALTVLNELLGTYAGGKLGKIRPNKDGTMEILVVDEAAAAAPYSIDGLSSGQKEIISTLFMIWEKTRGRPAVVLIDEPELHLNGQWHNRFIKDMLHYAPHNQYIIATHSEQVADSVPYENRVMLH